MDETVGMLPLRRATWVEARDRHICICQENDDIDRNDQILIELDDVNTIIGWMRDAKEICLQRLPR